MAWQAYCNYTNPVPFSDYEIFLYDGVSATNISNDHTYGLLNADTAPQVNALGHVVWIKDLASLPLGKKEIYFSDGSSPINLWIKLEEEDLDPRMNDSDNVVWSGYDGSDYEIFFWDGQLPVGVHVTQITNNGENDSGPRINNDGKMVWHGSDGSDNEIFYWDGQFPLCGPHHPAYRQHDGRPEPFYQRGRGRNVAGDCRNGVADLPLGGSIPPPAHRPRSPATPPDSKTRRRSTTTRFASRATSFGRERSPSAWTWRSSLPSHAPTWTKTDTAT